MARPTGKGKGAKPQGAKVGEKAGSPSNTPARARPTEDEKREAQSKRDGIIRGIMTDMCEGRWQTGKSHQALADAHGVELATVRSWAAEAAMVLRQCRGDGDEIRDAIIAGIEHVHRLALDQERHGSDGEAYPAPDLKATLGALELRAKVLGLMVTKVQDVTPPKEQLLDQIRLALRSPPPELAAVLAEEGWVRA